MKDSPPKHHKTSKRLYVIVALLVTTATYLFYSRVYQFDTDATDTTDTTDVNHFHNNIAPSDHSFAVKHIYHHNTDKGDATHGRMDVSSAWVNAAQKAQHLNLGHDTHQYMASQARNPYTDLKLKSKAQKVKRWRQRDPDHVESYLEAARLNPMYAAMDFDWVEEEILVPDVTDRDTVVSLAVMASNAYVDVPFTGDWTNVSWKETGGIGWQSDGVRGHIFVDQTPDSPLVVIALKGTSAAIFDSGGDTVVNDKTNDNLLFSCCCARVSYLWSTVCDCYTGESYTCDQECLEKELYAEDRYYRAVLDIYRNVTHLYPQKQIWVTGHSLGGALSAMLGRTYGLPAVGYEAPGELLPTKRLHLPTPPGIPWSQEHIWHFGHTADPIFMGVCNGASSSCSIGGYAMETSCHSGLQCMYDVVTDKGWHLSMVNHRIHTVIDEVLLAYNETAACVPPPPCQDCFNWNFVMGGKDKDKDDKDKKKKKTSSSSVASSTSTSTSSVVATNTMPALPDPTCVERNWYGKCIRYDPEIEHYHGRHAAMVTAA
ncbi:putative lipase ATG15 [Yarrowia sp. B02]|nr:putative lipase ATG15 [Yarrowia sp. B02]